MKRVWITGARGQLGSALLELLEQSEAPLKLFHIGRNNIDLLDADRVLGVAQMVEPSFVVNCAAYTDVDGAETHQKEAFDANVIIPSDLVMAALECTFPLIHISTDHIFGGYDSNRRVAYTEEDYPAPANYYGLTKYLGEHKVYDLDKDVYILRTSWLYGPDRWSKKNFYKTIRQKALAGESLKVVEDEVSAPTSVLTLARVIKRIILDYGTEQQLPFGIYHVTDFGEASRYEFAKEILSLDPNTSATNLEPCKQSDLNADAIRPKYSKLDVNKIRTYYPDLIRPWQEALKEVYNYDNPIE